ncbi:Dolichyl-diphosphooligosaccharide-protein glycosyltransferase subunit dad1, partial [Kappamyces sp. JEL0680]
PSQSVLARLIASYSSNTPQLCKLVDAFLLFTMLTGVIQFLYMLLVGTYPYNAFLAGFATSCGMFVNAGKAERFTAE